MCWLQHHLHELQFLTQISFFDNSKGQFEVCGRLQTARTRGIPTALATVAIDAPTEAARERLLYGDSSGKQREMQLKPTGMPAMPQLATGSPDRRSTTYNQPGTAGQAFTSRRSYNACVILRQGASSCCTRARGNTACR
jgi:hypothetical protein